MTGGASGRTAATVRTTTAVAAAASVPCSSTSMYALCTTALTESGSAVVMPVKSAPPGWKACLMPSCRSAGIRPNSLSSRNLGIASLTRRLVPRRVRAPSRAVRSAGGWSGGSGSPSGSTIVMASPPPR